MICPVSRWENKRVADTTWSDFLREATSAYALEIFLIYSGEEEKLRAERIVEASGAPVRMIGQMTLPLWHALMAKMDGVISVDSAGLHLAATTGVPTLSLFGPSSAAIFGPHGQQHASIQGSCPYGESFLRRCSRLRHCATGACLKDLSTHMFFKNFQEWWSGVQSRRVFPPSSLLR
jgi:heptosyltransferase-1